MSKKSIVLNLTIVALTALAWGLASAADKPAPADKPKAEAPAKAGDPSAAVAAGADATEAARAAEAAKKGLVALSLELPKPRFSGTPKSLPPGTRVKIPKGPTRPRPPFYAPKDCKNVAHKKPVTSSDMEPVIGSLDLVTDGNKEAVEDAYVELGPNVQWVQIDLKDKFKLHAMLVWHEPLLVIQYFQLGFDLLNFFKHKF